MPSGSAVFLPDRPAEQLTHQDTAMLMWSYVSLEEGLQPRTQLWGALLEHNVGRWRQFSIQSLSIVAWWALCSQAPCLPYI